MLCDFIVKLDAHDRKNINQWRQTRLVYGALVGKDPRHLISLPGDFDELDEMPEQEKIEMMFRAKKIWQQ